MADKDKAEGAPWARGLLTRPAWTTAGWWLPFAVVQIVGGCLLAYEGRFNCACVLWGIGCTVIGWYVGGLLADLT